MRAILIVFVIVLFGFCYNIWPALAKDGNFDSRQLLEEQAKIVKSGILPDSFFYWVDKFGEELKFVFTIGKEKKADYLIELAAERLAEKRALSEEGINKYADQLTNQYDTYIEMAQKLFTELNEESLTKAKELQANTEKEIFTQEKTMKREVAKAPAEYTKQRDSFVGGVVNWFNGILVHLKWKKGEIEKQEAQQSE